MFDLYLLLLSRIDKNVDYTFVHVSDVVLGSCFKILNCSIKYYIFISNMTKLSAKN